MLSVKQIRDLKRYRAVKKDVNFFAGIQGLKCVSFTGTHFFMSEAKLLAGLRAGERKHIVEREFAFTGNHLLQLCFMLAINGRGVQNRVDE